MEKLETKRTTVAAASEEYLKLLSYVLDQPHGETLDYTRVTQETGVPMDYNGKSKLRRAIIRSKKEYSVVPGIGYVLADAKTAVGVLGYRLQRVDSRIRRAAKAHQVLTATFYAELPLEKKQQVLFVGSVLAVFSNEAEKAKQIHGKKVPLITQGDAIPIVPD